jgi:hypothetical protein
MELEQKSSKISDNLNVKGYISAVKKTLWTVIVVMFLGSMPNAEASEIVIPGFATVNYSDSVKLKKTGCQNIPFNYVTDENLVRENTTFLIAITPKNTKRVYGYVVWFSTQTSKGENALPAMARIGILQLKVCRKAFMYSSESNRKTLAIAPGTYRIFFSAGNIDPVTGALAGEKIEIVRSIKFY